MKTPARKSNGKAGAQPHKVPVGDIMTRAVEVVAPNDTLQSAARKMSERDIGFLPICDGQRLVGTLSDRDIAVRAAARGLNPKSARVKELATQAVVWCFDDEDVGQAARKMQEKQVRRLMVIHRDDKQLVGVVSLGDLAVNGSPKIAAEVLQSVSPHAAS